MWGKCTPPKPSHMPLFADRTSVFGDLSGAYVGCRLFAPHHRHGSECGSRPQQPRMPNPAASQSPSSTGLGSTAVAIQVGNLTSINTETISITVVLQITDDDAEERRRGACPASGPQKGHAGRLAAQGRLGGVLLGHRADAGRGWAGTARAASHGRCGALRGHAEHLRLVALNVIGTNMASAIAAKLLEC